MTEQPAPRVVVLGGGGHCADLFDALCRNVRPCDVIGILDPGLLVGSDVLGVPVLGGDSFLSSLVDEDSVDYFAIGVGDIDKRRRLYQFCRSIMRPDGHPFEPFPALPVFSWISPLAVDIKRGVQLMPGANVGPFVTAGENVVFNRGCRVSHHVTIGAHSHIGPGATICGGATIGDEVFIGAGAVVLPGAEVASGRAVKAREVVK